MKILASNKLDHRISKILYFPGMDDNTLAQRKIYWIASLFVTTFIFLLTINYRIIFPGLRIIIYYGLFLTLIFLQGVILPLIMRKVVSIWYMFIDQTLVALATLLCILKLGGIPYSGGLVIVGLGLVFFSLNHKKKSHSIAIFLIYAVTILLAGILHPYLEVPPEMTPAVNISLFVVNLLWVSGFALIFVLNFISMRVKIEQSEAKRLKEMDEAKTRLYTNITHEFRTPLTIINGMVDLMRNDPEKWLKEGCNTIERNAANLLYLINQMLELSKLEAGALHVRMIRGDIQRYIHYIVELFRSVAQGKDIKLEYYPCAHDLKMDFEPEKLIIILSNLISNALKYSNPGSMVEVGTILKGKNKDVFKIRVSDLDGGFSPWPPVGDPARDRYIAHLGAFCTSMGCWTSAEKKAFASLLIPETCSCDLKEFVEYFCCFPCYLMTNIYRNSMAEEVNQPVGWSYPIMSIYSSQPADMEYEQLYFPDADIHVMEGNGHALQWARYEIVNPLIWDFISEGKKYAPQNDPLPFTVE